MKIIPVFDEDGNFVTGINAALAKTRNINIEKAKNLYRAKHHAEKLMEQITSYDKLKYAFDLWTKIQYDLQTVWGFPRSRDYHRFWEVPKCTCPKLDNEDAYGTAMYYINKECPVHGDQAGSKI